MIDQDREVPGALKQLAQGDILAVDTEFLWERTYRPRLALLQVATYLPDGDALGFAFDPLAVDVQPVVELLAEKSRLKLFHAGRIDLELLNALAPRMLSPVFDTQKAAALCGLGGQVGYAGLVEATLGETIPKTEQYADWTKRPLRAAQVEYALMDVLPLLDVHEELVARLKKSGRLEWAEEEMADLTNPASYKEMPPHERYLKVKGTKGVDRRGMAVLRELASWREQESERRDLRPTFVAKDTILIDLARRKPQRFDDLSLVRGLHPGELKRNGKAILAAIQRGLECPENELPERKKRTSHKKLGGVLDLLKAYMSQRSEELGIASETIATSKDLERLAKDDERERFAKDHSILQGWRRELVGDHLCQILRGEVSLAVDPESEGKLKLTR